MSFDLTTAATASTPAETYFTTLGDDYAQSRPSYPGPAFDCLLANLPIVVEDLAVKNMVTRKRKKQKV